MDSKTFILDKLCSSLLDKEGSYKDNIRNLNRAIALFCKDKYKGCYKDINKKMYLGLLDVKGVYKIACSNEGSFDVVKPFLEYILYGYCNYYKRNVNG